MGTWRIKVSKGLYLPFTKKSNTVFISRDILQVLVGQKDQLPKSKHECNTFSSPSSNGNTKRKNVPVL